MLDSEIACFQLASIFLNGIEVDRDLAQAKYWAEKMKAAAGKGAVNAPYYRTRSDREALLAAVERAEVA